ncbi:hypothetical protein ACH45F_22220 [Catenuloplanes sp. NPDC020197]|uniref:Uncharacterized protein n=1 Tax=Catenuloplanes niger TaxID=587534 RepID=A0AAE3ZW71_9ACTN|nr:hypothetical protein [Catenuloplanes niger]MDR7326304.1 hypothetical protein [Catenuloplanes niger]
MTDVQSTDLDAALERVFEAARAHLAAVRASGGAVEDDNVGKAYVALNNASFEYDELLLDAFNEVTPWDVKPIDEDEAAHDHDHDHDAPSDPFPHAIAVRQRRDYRVPSVSALIRVAESARRAAAGPDTDDAELGEPITSVGEAVLELLQSGDGSLGELDIPELEPLDGLVTVTEVAAPLDLDAFEEEDGDGPFAPGPEDRLLGRLDEHPFLEAPDEER